jgi:hypothetical protein
MKIIKTAGAAVAAVSLLLIQVQAEVILVDFGNDSSYRGASVSAGGAGIDENGNHWNSVWSGAYYANMKDKDGNAPTIDVGFGTRVGGTDYFNGPSGGTADPTATVYNGAALGNLGADEAVYDYYRDSNFTIQGLDPTKTYNLTFYGSFKYNLAAYPTGESSYTLYSSNDYSTVVSSATLAHNDESITGFEWNHNQDRTVTISGVSPQFANSLWVGVDGVINAMQIEVIPEPATLGMVASLGFGVLVVRRFFRI